MCSITKLFLVLVSCISVRGEIKVSDDCFYGKSTSYKGNRNYTISGKICQKWNVNEPHMYRKIPKDSGQHNYCRNPDNDGKGTWCYTVDNNTRWEHCNISHCYESFIIWTSHGRFPESSQLLRAEIEKVDENMDGQAFLNITVLPGSNSSKSVYWALAGDHENQRLYFVDVIPRQNYIGIWDLNNNIAEKYFEGMAANIENIALDHITGNVYWTDSRLKWVMVAEKKLKYYTPIYRTPSIPYGLAVHSVKRLLFLSTYKALASKIIVMDLAGQNKKVLFKFPEVFDVTGITIDYAEDRIYWTDFTGYGSLIMSSFLDGTNKTQVNYRAERIYWGLALYRNFLYVSDIHSSYDLDTKSRYYHLWIIEKNKKNVLRYRQRNKPRGVVSYTSEKDYSISDIPPSPGDCTYSEVKCDQICLPRANAKRVCACTLGTYLDETSQMCRIKYIKDDYLLIVDAGQRKIFQMPITSAKNESSYYNAITLNRPLKPSSVAVDPNSKLFYWSDMGSPSITRAALDGRLFSKIAATYANSIVVDPHTGNLFYSDKENGTILISNKKGTSKKIIVYPELDKNNSPDIRMLTQDVKHKYIYWTSGTSERGGGQVLRCRYDGSDKEVVLDRLDWPHAITTDYKKNRLYVVEAKNAVIYETELSALVEIDDMSPARRVIKQYDISAYVPFNRFIVDFKIHEDMAYLADEESNSLYRFSLTKGVASIIPYGPTEFYKLTSLSVFSKSYFEESLKSQSNPCKNSNCQEICVAMSETESKCLCHEGKVAVGNYCILR